MLLLLIETDGDDEIVVVDDDVSLGSSWILSLDFLSLFYVDVSISNVDS